ncbi:hypothetical protein [Bacillus sp. NPDC094106]|uniref:hypothetical protein n=1 Tax=Bacillus sp. NPDC094106 TaxID=3363949 RepID=UPI003816B20E
MDGEGCGCLAFLAIVGVLFYCFPLVMTIVTCTIIFIAILLAYFDSKDKTQKFINKIKSELPQRLRITKDEVIYDFGEKGVFTWYVNDFRVFTSRGEYLVKIKNEGTLEQTFELVQVSDVDFIKESKQ